MNMGKCQLCGQPYGDSGNCSCMEEANSTIKRNDEQTGSDPCLHKMLTLGFDGDYACMVCSRVFKVMITLKLDG